MKMPNVLIPLMGSFAEEEWCALCRLFRERVHREWNEFGVSSTAMRRWIGQVWDKLPEAFR